MAYEFLRQLGYDPENPALETFQQGVKPQPTYDFLNDIGYEIPTAPAAPPEPDVALFEKGSVGQQIVRAGEILGEGSKDVGRGLAYGMFALTSFLNRMEDKYFDFDEEAAVQSYQQTAAMWGPKIATMAADDADFLDKAELAMQMLAESEYLKRDPEKAQTHNIIEDILMVGPQIGGMVLANVVAPGAGIPFMGLMIMGHTYQDLIQQGVDPDRAFYYSFANGVIQGAMENIPYLGLAKRLPKAASVGRKLVEVGRAAGTEFMTEWMQSYPDSFINIFATNPDEKLLDRADMFLDSFWETTKQGMYEGLITAPWTLLMAGGAHYANKWREKNKDKLDDAPTDEEAYQMLTPDEYVDLGYPALPPPPPKGPVGLLPAPPERASLPMPGVESGKPVYGDTFVIPEWNVRHDSTNFRVAPTRQSSSVDRRTVDLMDPERQEAYLNRSFDEIWADRQANFADIQRNRDLRLKRALAAANDFAKSKQAHAYWAGDIEEDQLGFSPYDAITDRDVAARERIQKGLNLIPHTDAFDGEKLAISQREYDRRVRLLDVLGEMYTVDRNSVPADLRGAVSLMTEQVGQGEAGQYKDAKYSETGETIEEGNYSYSTYPEWFKAPFRINYYDSRIAKDEAGKTIYETALDNEGKPITYKRGKKKGEVKKIPKREMGLHSEDFKYGFSRDEYLNIIGKLETGQLLTARESAIADHVLSIAQSVKDTDPQFTQAEDLKELEADGYEILGTETNLGSFNLADQVVVEKENGEWDSYTVVSEDDGAGNVVLDSTTDRIQGSPDERVRTIGHKRNGYWDSMRELGGDAAVDNAPTTLPGVEIEPLHVLKDAVSMAQLEEGFASNLPEVAEFFDNPEGVATDVAEDRRKADKTVPIDRRKGERRQDWDLRDDINKMTPEERGRAIEKLRIRAMTDGLTGLFNKDEHDRHLELIGTDNPYIFLDLDGFKWINDFTAAGWLPDGRRVDGGYPLGDQVLGLFARSMREAVERTGVGDHVRLFRRGGDEFAIALTERNGVTLGDMRTLRDAIAETSSQIMLDILGKDGIEYYLDGLPYTAEAGGTANAAITATKKAKDAKPAEYAEGVKEGEVTRAKIPGTLVEKRPRQGGRGAEREGVVEAERPVTPGRDTGETAAGEEAAVEEEQPPEKAAAPVAVAPTQKAPVGVAAPIILEQPKPPRKKPEAAKFVSENIEILDGIETAQVNVTYVDPNTGETLQVRENAMEALRDVEQTSDLLHQLRECINA